MTRAGVRAPLVTLGLVAASCSEDLAEPDAPPMSMDASPDADKLEFETTQVTSDDGVILIERVTYRSGGLVIVGQVCRPVGAGPFPVFIANHGGFAGIGEWNDGGCADAAGSGTVYAESSYRGEDGSEGTIEVCAGEVDDVLRLTQLVLAQPYADPMRVFMMGVSHGGCITGRAVERGAPVVAAVDISGPTDWVSGYAFWEAAIAKGAPETATYQYIVETLEAGAGGTPATAPDAYTARSPLSFAGDLQGFSGAFLIVHGGADDIVPVGQSCDLAAAAGGFEAYHLDATQVEVASAPAGCEGAGLTWQQGPRPSSSWPGDRYLIVYDGTGHYGDGAGGAALEGDVIDFLVAKTPL